MNASRVRPASKGSIPPGENDAARTSHARMANDVKARSGKERRSPRNRNLEPEIETIDNVYSLIGRDFFYTAPVFAGAAIATAVLAGSLPSIGVALLIAGSTGLIAVSRKSLALEAKFGNSLAKLLGLLYLVVGGSMFLFGMAFSIWTRGMPIGSVLIAGCACLVANVVAIASLHNRLPGMVVAMTGITVGGVILVAPLAAVALIAISIVGEIVLTSRFRDRIREVEQHRTVKWRRQVRAESLLSEYEQSGQVGVEAPGIDRSTPGGDQALLAGGDQSERRGGGGRIG